MNHGPASVLLTFFDGENPKLADALDTWTTVAEVEIGTFNHTDEIGSIGSLRREQMIVSQEVRIAFFERIQQPERYRGPGDPPRTDLPAGPMPWNTARPYAAIRATRGGTTYTLIGVMVQQGPAAKYVTRSEFLQCPPEAFPFWRRWQAGFWPWEARFMDGEVNKIWEAIGALETRSRVTDGRLDEIRTALVAVEHASQQILNRLRRRDEPQPEVRRLYSVPMLAGAIEQSRPVQVEIEPGVRYEAWSAEESAWVPVDVIRMPGEEEEEEDALDEPYDD